MPSRPSVLVTAIGSYGEQILKALRQPGATPCRIIGGDTDPYSPHFSAVDEPVVLPQASDRDYTDAVIAICKKYDIAAVFPGCEPELLRLSRDREEFSRAGVLLMINPAAVIELCGDKMQTALRLRELGFEPPRSAIIRSAGDMAGLDYYPMVVKPRLGGGGSKGCYIAQSRHELDLLLGYADPDHGLFVQEYVGTPDQEYTVGVLIDLDGNLVNSIVLRRNLAASLSVLLSVANRSGRRALGDRLVISSGVSQGEIGGFPEVAGPCEKIAVAIGTRAPINIQCRLVDGHVKVFEINPRFSGTTSIRAMMGYNEPDVLLRRHVLHQDTPARFEYRYGRIARSLRELIVPQSPAPGWRQLLDG